MNTYAERTDKTVSQKDKTGIPHKMKANFENSSGFSFDDVRVHYNSEKPAQLHAHAYTQGNEVYVAPGQEKHLPHELGHVVQQKSNMVKPTGEIDGLPLNDDMAMENSADMIAAKAQTETPLNISPVQAKAKNGIVQAFGFMDFLKLASSGESYNLFAGPVSALTSLGGVIGGIWSYWNQNNRERKHRYIEEIEKYADAACEAREEQIANNKLSSRLIRDEDYLEKAKADADALKQKSKVKRNYDAAIEKTIVMEKIKTDQTGQEQPGQPQPGQPQPGQPQPGQPQPGQPQPEQQKNQADNIRNGDFNLLKDKNVKNALTRAKKAYEDSIRPQNQP